MVSTEPSEIAAEMAAEKERFSKSVALSIAIMAVVLALANVGGDNASEDAVNANIEASDLWAFFQAKTIRQTVYRLGKDELELQRANPQDASQADAAYREKMDRLIANYQDSIDRYERDPVKREGTMDLMEKAQAAEARRDASLSKDNRFDTSTTVLQLAIVLASISILAQVPRLFWVSVAVAVTGAAVTATAYLM